MTFVGKNSKSIIRVVVVLMLATGLCFSSTATAREINDGTNESEYESEYIQTNRENEENQDDEYEITNYYTQNVYFTEDEQRYVVVYPDNSYVSLTRNENAENKSKKEVCQFL
ncbi:hypothetical protein [Methanimicrococcus blatticola]|uniref:Uncharacterized protein n=1 Tax=Methanimicrococcus blatticola TaxID=91560 RepID=A0A484F5Q0_9EURY|nr:hypothetical protein [Methanimicrococcus blatticola]MBZ3935030.1 hypothetical protein [Methanimicrococcus blatticola]MCC2508873.1 hypothetical protein [Methanimicrococcus blatticola]TDQ71100.1 hypothetical protein C7391_0200 [Methanimicrococcus blatticola]